jgi:hypothetical protein
MSVPKFVAIMSRLQTIRDAACKQFSETETLLAAQATRDCTELLQLQLSCRKSTTILVAVNAVLDELFLTSNFQRLTYDYCVACLRENGDDINDVLDNLASVADGCEEVEGVSLQDVLLAG